MITKLRLPRLLSSLLKHGRNMNCSEVCLLQTVSHTKVASLTVHGYACNLQKRVSTDKSDRHHDGADMGVTSKVLSHLDSLYSISEDEVKSLVLHTQLLKVSDQTIVESIDCLHKNDIEKEQLLRLPLLLMQGKDTLHSKLLKLMHGDHMFLLPAHGLGFCQSSISIINKMRARFVKESHKIPGHRNRIYYMSEKLKIPMAELSESVARLRNVSATPLEHITKIMDLLNDYKISREHILCDPWVLIHNIEKSEARLRTYHDHSSDKRKLWITRCPQHKFDSCMKKQAGLQADRELLAPHQGSIVRMLASKLDCRPEAIESNSFHATLVKLRATAVAEKIDMLLAWGFTPLQIGKNLRMLDYSKSRLMDRFRLLQDLSEPTKSLFALYRPQANFDTYYKKRAKNTKKTENSKKESQNSV